MPEKMGKKVWIRGKLVLSIFLISVSFASASTYYVSKSGNDSNTGRSWGAAWSTITKVNNTVAGGDTVFWGSGIWRGTTLIPISGTSGRPTVYACSSFVAANGSGQYHFAQIWASDSISGWETYSGNVYRAAWASTVNGMYQGDSLLRRQSSLANVNAPGKFFQTGGYVYAYAYNIGSRGNNPALYDMEGSANYAVYLARTISGGLRAVSYVTLWGLNFSYGYDQLVTGAWDANGPYSHVHIEHCKLEHVYGDGGQNVSLVNSNLFNPPGTDVWVRACSLGYVWAYPYGGDPNSVDWYHGNAITNYGVSNMVIDSSTFYGYFSFSNIYFKNDHATVNIVNDTIRYNIFRSSQLRLWNMISHCAIYGNIFWGGDGIVMAQPRADAGPIIIRNNTFYNTTRVIEYSDAGEGGGARNLDDTVKFNIYYGTNASMNWYTGSDSRGVIDSNMYYTSTFKTNPPTTSRTFSVWQGLGFDNHSANTVNPGYSNPSIGDFSRPGAGQEMNVAYAGRTWTKYGAVQDNMPPPALNVSNIRTTDLSGTSATIRWDSNIPASSQVDYGLTSSYGSSTTLDNNQLTAHVQTVNGLAQLTTYHYRVRSRAGSGNEVLSGDNTFTTLSSTPVITGVGSGNPTSSSATITWTTNIPASTQVDYGLTTGYGSSTALDTLLITAHSKSLFGLSGLTTYHYRVRSRSSGGIETLSGDYSFRTDSLVTFRLLSVNVPDTESGVFSGYNYVPVNDGLINGRGGTSTTWASDQSANPHWAEMDFIAPKTISRMKVYWAWNSARAAWMCSQQYNIQYWDAASNSFLNAATVNNTTSDSITTTDFPPVTTTKIRFWQPANMGPLNYSAILWLTELELYGQDASNDTIPPATILDLNAIPANGQGHIRLQWSVPCDDNGTIADFALIFRQDLFDISG